MIWMGDRRAVLAVVALVAVLVPACSHRPQVRESKGPILGSETLGKMLRPDQLEPETVQYLKSHDLYRDYRKDPNVAIRELRSRLGRPRDPAAVRTLVDLCVLTAERNRIMPKEEVLGYYMAGADIAYRAFVEEAGRFIEDDELRGSYNHCCAQAAVRMFRERDPESPYGAIDGPWSTYQSVLLPPTSRGENPDYYDELWDAAYLEFEGVDLEREVLPGFGGALVAHREFQRDRREAEPFLGPMGTSIPVNVMLHFEGNRVDLEIRDLLLVGRGRIGDLEVPLAADYTAPLATLYNYLPDGDIGISGLLRPGRYADRMGIFQFEPFREGQIPVVLVHGLASSPATWVRAINALRSDPVLRERYQLYAFYYPTGFPILKNAAGLRKHLAKLDDVYGAGRGNELMDRLVLIGHSMGGILSSMEVRSSGEKVRAMIFDKPLDDVTMTRRQREGMRELLYFQANDNVERAVFVAAPHRGSELAINPIVRFAVRLIRFPVDLVSLGVTPYVDGLTAEGRQAMTTRPTSVESLSPDNSLLHIVPDLPVQERTTVHSIIGVKDPSVPLEDSTDGVVAYWSSHLDGVESEFIAPATHVTINGEQNAVEEMRRILYVHAGLPEPDEPLEIWKRMGRIGEEKKRSHFKAKRP